MSQPTNDLLRSHVTRVGFDLTLGKTHIAALVLLNEQRYCEIAAKRLAQEVLAL